MSLLLDRVSEACLRPQRAQRLALRRSCSCRSSWRRALESMTEEEAIEVMLTSYPANNGFLFCAVCNGGP